MVRSKCDKLNAKLGSYIQTLGVLRDLKQLLFNAQIRVLLTFISGLQETHLKQSLNFALTCVAIFLDLNKIS